MRKNSGASSSIIFDYFPPSIPDGTCDLIEARRLTRAVEKKGEPFVFGMNKNDMEVFLKEKGFCKIKNIRCDDLKKRYFTGKNEKRYISPILSFVTAESDRI